MYIGLSRYYCTHALVSSLFINTALMLWAFNITQHPSAPIDPNAFTDESLIYPQPYTVNFAPRIDGLTEMLKEGDD